MIVEKLKKEDISLYKELIYKLYESVGMEKASGIKYFMYFWQ